MMKKDKREDMPPVGIILGGPTHEQEPDVDDDEDPVAPDHYDTAAADESIRAVHSKDPEGHADAIHQLVDSRLRHHGLLKDEEDNKTGEDDAEEEGEAETTGKGSSH